MPRYLVTFDDGSSVEKEAANAGQAKQEAKREAQQKTGAITRTDPRVKVAHVVDLDVEAGPTDPRQRQAAGASRGGDAQRLEREAQQRDDQRERDARARDTGGKPAGAAASKERS